MNRYLTIPQNFNCETYYRFELVNRTVQNIIKQKKINEIIIIDIGCGDGQLLKFIKEKSLNYINFEFIGIDMYIKEKAFDFKLYNYDLEFPINLPSNFADIIIAGEIIEHLVKTDQFLNELYRILNENGDLIVTSPNLASYLNRFLLLCGYQPYHSEVSEYESGFGLGVLYNILGRPKTGNKTAGHLRLFTYRALKDFTEFYGFKLIKYYPIYFTSYKINNPRIFLIKFFFFIDKVISTLFPKLASGMMFHLQKVKKR